MTTRSLGPLAGLHWLRRSIHLGRGNPRAVFGGAALLAGVALVPSIVQLLLLGAVQPGGEGAMAVAVAATLMSLLLMPPLIGGYLRVIDATERGLPARPTDVFAPFKQGQGAGRLIGLGMLITALYLLMAWVVVSIFGDGLLTWYQQMAQLAQTPPVEPADLPAPPDGFGRVLGLVSLLALFLGGVYAIGFGQVALGGRRVGAALGDGIVGTLKNLLPLLLLAIVAMAAMLVIALVLGMVLAVLGVIGGLVHPVLGAMLALPVYLAFLLVLYVVLFGIMYFLWRDVCADAPPPPAANPGEVAA
ncbi:MAG: hypothetical protein NDI66_07210 [Pseudomonas sp.]|nr:hypothetical protein [Pseudomonas sp.]